MSPSLDLSDALTDDNLTDSFSVVRRVETVNGYGESTVATNTISPVYGVVTAGDDNKNKRGADEQHADKSITVITAFRLQGPAQVGGTGYQPDVVIWGGDSYIVNSVDDYSHYAAGFVQAKCSSIDSVDAPPQA